MTGSHKLAEEKYNSGFTLVEMAMVLFIVTLLLSGLVPTITSQMEQQRTNETRKLISEISEALIGYAIINGRLPCPADPTKVTGASGAGAERATCTTASDATGIVPWATLGTSETDAWGNRFSYRVRTDFADAIASATYGGCTPSPIPTQASFGLCSTGNLTVKSASAGTNVATGIPAIIVSHGKNGAGAWTQKGVQLAAGSSADEVANSDGDTDYVSRIQTSDFDDLAAWITPNILYNRMITAGKLP